ncbi:hypothetical protein [Methylomicrobium lacus]|uniref:hypothetical protein n=1 Tax=Methylomicrobium lacus TaxID=136992 RepID=UPI001268213F|nr:hypothetical protein [Methylomicrobium lacus]
MSSSLFTKIAATGLVIMVPTIAVGESSSPSTTEYGSSAASQTSSLPVYQNKGGTTYNLQSTTTVNGGYQYGGSGNVVPSNNPNSQSSTSYGVGVTIPFSTGNR